MVLTGLYGEPFDYWCTSGTAALNTALNTTLPATQVGPPHANIVITSNELFKHSAPSLRLGEPNKRGNRDILFLVLITESLLMQVSYKDRLGQINAVQQTSDQLDCGTPTQQMIQAGIYSPLSTDLRSHATGGAIGGASNSADSSLSPAQCSR